MMMIETEENFVQQLNVLVEETRPRCLWFLREDYYPHTTNEILKVLDYIQQHGDVSAFQRAATLRQWLLQNSNAPSAV
ncbi:MAG: hypothetical protein ACXW18_07100 [Pyrinomonadaceae bacterium]